MSYGFWLTTLEMSIPGICYLRNPDIVVAVKGTLLMGSQDTSGSVLRTCAHSLIHLETCSQKKEEKADFRLMG